MPAAPPELPPKEEARIIEHAERNVTWHTLAERIRMGPRPLGRAVSDLVADLTEALVAASAQLLPPALSKRVPELMPDPLMDPDSSTSSMELPLTSEPPLADVAPLTSEPPLADATPLTSEPTAYGTAAGI